MVKVRLYWPECNYQNEQWSGRKIDSFWVECTYEEAQSCIFPRLNEGQIRKSRMYWDPRSKKADMNLEDTDMLCYLVSKNLESITPLPWYYPYSGEWNAYCPFEEIDEVEITDLKELAGL
ncbi:MAG: hypothetical protein ACM3ZR_00240 [Pseudomonadota bacterium]